MVALRKLFRSYGHLGDPFFVDPKKRAFFDTVINDILKKCAELGQIPTDPSAKQVRNIKLVITLLCFQTHSFLSFVDGDNYIVSFAID